MTSFVDALTSSGLFKKMLCICVLCRQLFFSVLTMSLIIMGFFMFFLFFKQIFRWLILTCKKRGLSYKILKYYCVEVNPNLSSTIFFTNKRIYIYILRVHYQCAVFIDHPRVRPSSFPFCLLKTFI